MLRSSSPNSKDIVEKKKGIKAVAIYDNFGGSENELEFSKGDIVYVLERNSDGKWKGEINNVVGYFPGSFVKIVEEFIMTEEPVHVKQLRQKDFILLEVFIELDIASRREQWYKKQQQRRNMERKMLFDSKSKSTSNLFFGSIEAIESIKLRKEEWIKRQNLGIASPNTLLHLGHVKFQRRNLSKFQRHPEFVLISLDEPTIMDLEVFEKCYRESPLYEKNKQTRIILDPITKSERIIKLQFARDCLNLIRINGHPIEGRSDEEKALHARNMIFEYTEHNQERTNLIMELATQNLGIWLYDSYMQKYLINSEKPVIMTQTGCHYIDILMEKIVTEEKQLEIYFMGLFKIQEEDALEDIDSAFYLKTTIELDLMKTSDQVRVSFSKIERDLLKLAPRKHPISSINPFECPSI